MVKQPLKFSMSDLMRYPSVSKFYFLECSGNGLTDWTKAASTTVQQSHGLLSCAQWTGIPVATLLDEAGIDPAAKWVLFEGADGSAHARSIPIEKVMADTLLVYGQNGERLRPEQGYPLRAAHPGLGRQRFGQVAPAHQGVGPALEPAQRDRALHRPDARGQMAAVQLRHGVQVRHHPTVGRDEAQRTGHLPDRGLRLVRERDHQSRRCDVRRRQELARGGARGAVLDRCLTRFRYVWEWDGGPAKIASRAVDSTGYVQPTVAEIAKARALAGFVQHHNGIFPWSVSPSGEVKNAIA